MSSTVFFTAAFAFGFCGVFFYQPLWFIPAVACLVVGLLTEAEM